MNYIELKARLFDDITEFLDNGFKQKLVKAVEDRILPQLQTLVLDLHQKATDARDGVWIHEREMLRKELDRKTTGIADRVGTLEMYMPQVRILGDTVKELEVENDKQRVATAKLETCAEHLEGAVEKLGGKVDGQAEKLDEVEDKPGREALKNRAKWKWVLVGGLISLGVCVVGGGLLLWLT